MVGIQHPDTIKNYLEYIQQTYLIFQLFRYDPSVKKQMMSPKKIYFVDNAIIKRIGFNATENNGVFLENLVFIELKRRGWDVYYYADKKECDFIVRKGLHISDAYQVTLKMDSPQTREREIAGVRLCKHIRYLKDIFSLLRERKLSILMMVLLLRWFLCGNGYCNISLYHNMAMITSTKHKIREHPWWVLSFGFILP